MKILLLLVFTLSSTLIYAQSFSYPKIKTSGTALPDFVIPNWFIKDSAHGDLNGDKRPDLAFVLEYKDTIQERRPSGYDNYGSPRILAVLFKNNKTGTYDLFLQNNTFITRYGEGGMDPEAYGELTITNGLLHIVASFLRGAATYKFRYQNNDLYLIGATSTGVSGGKFYGFDVNFNTYKAKIEEGKIEDDKLNVKWITVPRKPLKRLRDMKMLFDWEVVKGQFI